MFERYYVRWQRRYPDQSHLLESLLMYISYWKPLAAISHNSDMQHAPAWHNDPAHEVLTALCRCIQAEYIHYNSQTAVQAGCCTSPRDQRGLEKAAVRNGITPRTLSQ